MRTIRLGTILLLLAGAATGAESPTGLSESQDLLSGYADLLALLPRVAESLKASDPENAARIQAAHRKALSARTDAEIELLIQDLLASRTFAALEHQGKVVRDLQDLRELLTRRQAAVPEVMSGELAEHLKTFEALLARQQALRATLRPDEQLVKGRQDAQELLRHDTDKAAAALGQGARPLPRASDKARSASRNMGQAAEALARNRSPEKDQEGAIEDLRFVIDDLSKRMEDSGQERRKQELFQLAEALQRSLEGQVQVHQATAGLDKAAKPYGRPEQIKLAKAKTDQRSLAVGLGEAIRTLDQEDATIFSWALKQCQEDMGKAADRLDQSNTDAFTRQIQADVEASLIQLIEALEEEAGKPAPARPPGEWRTDRHPADRLPLLPPAAQLKLLKALQASVFAKTRDADLARFRKPEGYETLTPEERERVDRIAQEQERIAGITRAWGERLPSLP